MLCRGVESVVLSFNFLLSNCSMEVWYSKKFSFVVRVKCDCLREFTELHEQAAGFFVF